MCVHTCAEARGARQVSFSTAVEHILGDSPPSDPIARCACRLRAPAPASLVFDTFTSFPLRDKAQ